jgi:rhodanese-related sulfurtransferase
MSDTINLDPQVLRDMLARGEKLYLLDCREPWEHDVARIEGAALIPMREIAACVEKIPRDCPVVVYCHHGQRSTAVAMWMREEGIEARSLSGGIDRWSSEIDGEVPRY